MQRETKIISEGKIRRELVDITTLPNGKKASRTYHQEMLAGIWMPSKKIKKERKK